ncbi:MAG TPA: MBL fold metallo-hydrolase [Steroidobacteraceae bacterium]|nr:MBL fold metallo-hydrolase [Steroidobacteraceae bacterium]
MSRTIFAALIAMQAALAQAQAPEEVKVETEEVAPGVYVLYGRGGNIGVSAGADGVFLIDDQYANMTAPVEEALAKIQATTPRFVINTHWHGDHTGGNENLASKGSVVVAHDNVRARMSVEHFSEFFQRTTPPSPAGALPVVTFSDNLSLHVNGDELRGVHVGQAHTDGDVFIHFRKANVIHTGDLVFHAMYPFVDLDSGGSVAGVIAAVDRMLALADDRTRVIPGHGRVTDRKGLQEYRQLLVTTRERMRERVQAGRTLDEVLAEKPFADFDGKLAWQFITAERFIQILYRDATRELSPGRT